MFIKQYTLTRIILQRHKSFLLPSNFSPRVVQQLRHPPIMILLLQRIIRMLPHRIILRRYQPRLLLPLLQTIRRQRHWKTRDGYKVVEWDANEEEHEGDSDDDLNDVRRNSRWLKNSVFAEDFFNNLDELITWGGHEYNHHNLDGIDQQNDVISLRTKRVN